MSAACWLLKLKGFGHAETKRVPATGFYLLAQGCASHNEPNRMRMDKTMFLTNLKAVTVFAASGIVVCRMLTVLHGGSRVGRAAA